MIIDLFLKVQVGVFYESLCPDSIRFIKNQLEPIYQHFDDFIHIDFIPFGKSKVGNKSFNVFVWDICGNSYSDIQSISNNETIFGVWRAYKLEMV